MMREAGIALKCPDSSKHLWLWKTHMCNTTVLDNTTIHTCVSVRQLQYLSIYAMAKHASHDSCTHCGMCGKIFSDSCHSSLSIASTRGVMHP